MGQVTRTNPHSGPSALWKKEHLRGKTHEEFMTSLSEPLDGAPAAAASEPPKSPRA